MSALGTICYIITKDIGVWGPGYETVQSFLTLPLCAERDFYLKPENLHKYSGLPISEDSKCLNMGHFVVIFVCKTAAVLVTAACGGPAGIIFPTIVGRPPLGGGETASQQIRNQTT